MRLPRLGPVGLVDDAGRQVADRPEPEGLEVAERGRHISDSPLDRRGIAGAGR